MKFNFVCVSLCVCMGLMCEHFDLTNLTRHFALWNYSRAQIPCAFIWDMQIETISLILERQTFNPMCHLLIPSNF